jgi:hypothetical protein
MLLANELDANAGCTYAGSALGQAAARGRFNTIVLLLSYVSYGARIDSADE